MVYFVEDSVSGTLNFMHLFLLLKDIELKLREIKFDKHAIS